MSGLKTEKSLLGEELLEIAKPCQYFFSGISVLIELAGPDGVSCICPHFVCWMRMNAFVALFKNFLGLSNRGLNFCASLLACCEEIRLHQLTGGAILAHTWQEPYKK